MDVLYILSNTFTLSFNNSFYLAQLIYNFIRRKLKELGVCCGNHDEDLNFMGKEPVNDCTNHVFRMCKPAKLCQPPKTQFSVTTAKTAWQSRPARIFSPA